MSRSEIGHWFVRRTVQDQDAYPRLHDALIAAIQLVQDGHRNVHIESPDGRYRLHVEKVA